MQVQRHIAILVDGDYNSTKLYIGEDEEPMKRIVGGMHLKGREQINTYSIRRTDTNPPNIEIRTEEYLRAFSGISNVPFRKKTGTNYMPESVFECFLEALEKDAKYEKDSE